jgi:hypothetical protein
MASDAASFLIELQDRLSGPAKGMQSALSQLEGQIQKEQKALQVLEQWMKRIQSAKSIDIAEHQKVAGLIDAQKSKLAGLSNQFMNLSQSAGAGGASGAIGEFSGALGGLPISLASVAAALAAVVVAIGAAYLALAKFALGAADSQRKFMLQAEALLGSAAAARELDDAIDAIAAKSPVLGDRLEELGKQLAFAGVRGDELKQALEAMAAVEAVVGQQAVDKYLKRIKAGEKLSKILDEINKKGILDKSRKLALSFDTQIAKLKENTTKLFEGINIEPFLEALHTVLSVFDQNTAAGKALKLIFEGLVQPIFDLATMAMPYVVAGLKQLIIWALQAYIAFKQFSKTETFDLLVDGLKVLGVVLGMVASAFLLVGAIAAAVLAGPIAAGIAIYTLLATVLAGVAGFVGNMVEAGYNLVMGIAQGIANGASGVVSAAIGAAQGAINAVKGALGIASPSKVMAEMGIHTMAGFGGGIEAGQRDVQSSMAAAVSPPSPAVANNSTRSSSSNVFNIVVNGGGSSPQETASALRVELEKFALQLGVA